jgi:hypothetical protein
MNDDLLVKVGHYIRGHDLEGGQGVMRAFIDLSLNYALPVELGGHISFNQ